MTTPLEQLKEAASEIKRLELKVKDILGHPANGNWQQKVSHVLTTLHNNIVFTVGTGNDATSSKSKFEPLTHIAGREISKKLEKIDTVADLRRIPPTDEKKKEMDGIMEEAWKDFQKLTAGELKEKYGDLIVRGIAVKAGMDVTPTSPAKINIAFVNSVKASVAAEQELMDAVTAADNAAAAEKAQSAPITQPAPDSAPGDTATTTNQ